MINEFLTKDYDDLTKEKNWWKTILHKACIAGELDIVKFLLKSGAPIEAKNLDGDTPLLTACICADVKIANLLIEFNANIQVLDNSQFSLLHIVSHVGHLKLIELLIQKGVDLNSNKAGISLLNLAYEQKELNEAHYLSIIELLIENGADFNLPDSNNESFFHKVSEAGDLTTIELLIRKGANITLKNNRGLTPLELFKIPNEFDSEVIIETLKNTITNNPSYQALLPIEKQPFFISFLFLNGKEKEAIRTILEMNQNDQREEAIQITLKMIKKDPSKLESYLSKFCNHEVLLNFIFKSHQAIKPLLKGKDLDACSLELQMTLLPFLPVDLLLKILQKISTLAPEFINRMIVFEEILAPLQEHLHTFNTIYMLDVTKWEERSEEQVVYLLMYGEYLFKHISALELILLAIKGKETLTLILNFLSFMNPRQLSFILSLISAENFLEEISKLPFNQQLPCIEWATNEQKNLVLKNINLFFTAIPHSISSFKLNELLQKVAQMRNACCNRANKKISMMTEEVINSQIQAFKSLSIQNKEKNKEELIKPPQEFFCSISQELIKQSMHCNCKIPHHFQKENIEYVFNSNDKRCPLGRLTLMELIPDPGFDAKIQKWREDHPEWEET